MSGFLLLFLALFFQTNSVFAADEICGKRSAASSVDWLKQFHSIKNDYDVRAKHAVCLIRYDFAKEGVAQAIFKTIKSENTDLIFKEDLILALSQANFRKKTAVDSELLKPLSQNEKQAVNRTIASAEPLLDVAGAVKKIDHIEAVTNIENDLLYYLSDQIKDANQDVSMRIASMQSLVTILSQIMKSGVYSEQAVKYSIDSIQYTSMLSDNASHYTRAKAALKFLGISDHARDRKLASAGRNK